ncbi:vitamin D3 hydroxylase-associated protein-like [Saccoglossus kowalevskii]
MFSFMTLQEFLKKCGQKTFIAAIAVILGGIYMGKKKAATRRRLVMFRDSALDRRQDSADVKMALAEKLHTVDEAVLFKRSKIIEMSLSELSKALKSGSLSAVEVLHAYQAKALECTSQINCVTEPINEAEEWAKELDANGDKSGILYGIPVSVKECVYLKGYDSHFGISKYIGKICTEDHVIVRVLKKEGAIPFMRTNVPQTMLSFSCSNPVYGETLNPHDCERCPGGSSGGEGALIGMHGSQIGIGSDIAGSVRVPAHFCGICSLKPTKNRISEQGEPSVIGGQKGLSGLNGVMARDVDGVVLTMKALLTSEMFRLDSSLPPIPFNAKKFSDQKVMRVGYYDDDGYFTPVPACRRAVSVAVEALKSRGHTLIPFNIPLLSGDNNDEEDDTAGNHVFELLHADGNKAWLSHLEGEAVDKHLSTQLRYSIHPSFSRRLRRPFMSRRMLNYYEACCSGDKSTSQIWSDYKKLTEYFSKFVSAWKDANIDVLIGPGFGITACSNKYAAKLFCLAGTTAIYNILDIPAGTVPVTQVTQEDEDNLATRFEVKDEWDRLAKEACTGSVGIPVGVQCIALKWQEELCLKLMKEVEEGVKAINNKVI